MVEQTPLDRVYRALAHESRREMLDRLAGGELTVGALARPLAISLAGASKHVRVLEDAGLIDRTVVGREHRCRLRPSALEPAQAWLLRHEAYWTQRLNALEDLVARPE